MMSRFDFTFVTPSDEKHENEIIEESKWTERMFSDKKFANDQEKMLPIQLVNASQMSKLSDAAGLRDCLPVLMNFGGGVERFKGINGIRKGQDILLLGGCRAGKGGQGRLWVPLEEVSDFCDRIAGLAAAVEAKLPEYGLDAGADNEPI